MIQYLNTQYQNLQEVATKYKSTYNTDQPFPHIYFQDFFNPSFLTLVREEFPDLSKLNTFH
jgi:hypothetical protein